jgi:flagellar FliL protein
MSLTQSSQTSDTNDSKQREERIMATTLSPVKGGAKGAPAEAGGADAAPKKSKKKLIIIVLVVLLIGGGAYYKMSSKPKGPVKPVPGAVVPLDSISLNLAESHFLKVGIALQTVKGAPATLDGSQALDLAISEFSGKTMAELSVPAKRQADKEEYLKALQKAYKDQIMDVYFTEFVMQ